MGTPPPIELGSLGMADSLILMVLALVVFGPRRLPQIGRQIGKLMYEFRKASNDFKFQMEEELRNSEDAERRKKEEDRLRAMALEAPAIAETTEVSQVSESGPGAPSEAGEDSSVPESGPGAPSPYRDEGLYPEMNSEVTPEVTAEIGPDMGSEVSVAELEVTLPRIQP